MFTFAIMTKGNKLTIRTLFIVKYSNILVKVRKSVKGLRISYLFSIQLIGENSGITCAELAKISGKKRSNVYLSVLRCIETGFIIKRDKRYYLTDKGQTVYNTVCKEFDVFMKEIIRILVEEARRQI